VYELALQRVRSTRTAIDDARRTVGFETQRVDRYRVEIHKKHSIAVACLIFVLIGAPLGLSTRRGGLATAGAMAVGIFLFYWVTLVQGEKLADRGFLAPWFGMWIANIVMIIVGVFLLVYVSLDLRATARLRRRADSTTDPAMGEPDETGEVGPQLPDRPD
jgi:lipopolysaccharide export system permease protein